MINLHPPHSLLRSSNSWLIRMYVKCNTSWPCSKRLSMLCRIPAKLTRINQIAKNTNSFKRAKWAKWSPMSWQREACELFRRTLNVSTPSPSSPTSCLNPPPPVYVNLIFMRHFRLVSLKLNAIINANATRCTYWKWGKAGKAGMEMGIRVRFPFAAANCHVKFNEPLFNEGKRRRRRRKNINFLIFRPLFLVALRSVSFGLLRFLLCFDLPNAFLLSKSHTHTLVHRPRLQSHTLISRARQQGREIERERDRGKRTKNTLQQQFLCYFTCLCMCVRVCANVRLTHCQKSNVIFVIKLYDAQN